MILNLFSHLFFIAFSINFSNSLKNDHLTYECDRFSCSNTAYATQNFVSCQFRVCNASIFTISLCDSYTGDTYIILENSLGSELSFNDDYCNYGSALTYTTENTGCSVYILKQGCYSSSSCSGLSTITVHDGYITTTRAPTTSPTQSSCPTSFVLIDGDCYFLSQTYQNWYSAVTTCQAMGATLATISSAYQQSQIANYFYWYSFWIGYSDVYSHGSYQWYDGSPVTYTNWYYGSPNSYGCTTMTSSYSYYWMAFNCYNSYLPLCQYRRSRAPTMAPGSVAPTLNTTAPTAMPIYVTQGYPRACYEATTSGILSIQPSNGGPVYRVYCDIDTADGGWMLLWSYAHIAGFNNPLQEGTIPTSPTKGYSHAFLNSFKDVNGNPVFTASSVRFYCHSSLTSRVISFTTTDDVVRGMVYDGVSYSNAASHWTSGYTLLSDHTANLPASTSTVNADSTSSLWNNPFYYQYSYSTCYYYCYWYSCCGYSTSYNPLYNWNIRGAGNRFECDDYSNDESQGTLHQIWVRVQEFTPSSTPTTSPTSSPTTRPSSVPTSSPTSTVCTGVRYAKITAASNPLQISQLAVYDTNNVNVAYQKTTTASPVATRDFVCGSACVYSPSYAVDGTLSSRSAWDGIYVSASSAGSFWMVDLGEEVNISEVIYFNRKDGSYSSRAIGYQIFLLASDLVTYRCLWTINSDLPVQTFIQLKSETAIPSPDPTAAPTSFPSFQCPSPFVFIHNGCYYFFNTYWTWHSGLSYCQSIGGSLATIISSQHETKINAYLLQRGYTYYYWIGYSDAYYRGTYSWIDGSTSTYTHWNYGPSYYGYCAVVYPYGGYWNSFYCYNGLPSLCQFHITSVPTSTPTTPTSTPSTEPTYSPSLPPTRPPTATPTSPVPTSPPSSFPTLLPISPPTPSPSTTPTSSSPSLVPSSPPTTTPTTSPTDNPTASPTYSPSTAPTELPSTVPTSTPSHSPTTTPTYSQYPTPIPTETLSSIISFTSDLTLKILNHRKLSNSNTTSVDFESNEERSSVSQSDAATNPLVPSSDSASSSASISLLSSISQQIIIIVTANTMAVPPSAVTIQSSTSSSSTTSSLVAVSLHTQVAVSLFPRKYTASAISSTLKLSLEAAVNNGTFTSNLHIMAKVFNDSILMDTAAISVVSYGTAVTSADSASTDSGSTAMSVYYIIAYAAVSAVVVLFIIVCCCCIGYFFVFRNHKLLPKIMRSSRKNIIEPQVEAEVKCDVKESNDVKASMDFGVEMVLPSAPPAPPTLLAAVRGTETKICSHPDAANITISIGYVEEQQEQQEELHRQGGFKNYEEQLEPRSNDGNYIDI